MTHPPIALAHLTAPGCATFREADNALWLGTQSGEIVTVRLLDRRAIVRGTGYQDLVAVLPADDGLRVYAVEAAGAVLEGARESGSRSAAHVVVDLERRVVAARLGPDPGTLLVLESGSAARLLRIDLASGSQAELAGHLADPVALAVDAATATAMVLQGPPAAREAVAVDLLTGVAAAPVPLPGTVSTVAFGGAPGPGWTVADDLGRLATLDAVGVLTPSTVTVDVPVRGLAHWGSLVLAVSDTQVEAVEWDLDAGPVDLRVPLGPVITNGFAKVEVDLGATGLAWDDLRIEVEEGPDAGVVSAGIQPAAPDGARRVRFVAGPFPGEAHIVAVRTSDGSRVGRARLRLTRIWPDDQTGPPVAVTGTFRMLASWGGGPVGPENIGRHAAPPTWRVAVVLVDTKDKAFQGDPATTRTTWSNRLVGAGTTAQQYYEEVSYRKTPAGASPLKGTTVSLADSGIPAVVHVDAGWGDLFENDDKAKVTPKPFGGWMTKPDVRSHIAGAYCDLLIDAGTAQSVLSQIDAVVFVIQNATEDVVPVGEDRVVRAEFCWPQAWQGVNFHWKGPTWTTVVAKPAIFMPTAYPTAMPVPAGGAKSFTSILVHELGHTLGCGDLYNKGDFPETVDKRLVGALDLMDNDWWLPHFSLANRMRLGWIDPTWIESIDFGVTPASRNVTLQAVESLQRVGLPGGRRAGIEVRIRPGRNYYIEYRRSQPAQLGDNNLNRYYPTSRMLVGTDVVSDGIEPFARPDIILLPQDADGDGPVLDAPGEDYAETDTTDPERQHDFRVVFDQIEPGDPNAVRVRVEYLRANRADLQIRPAPGRFPPAPPDWKSPDIDLLGPAGANTVAKGQVHTVAVRVRNGGTVDAEDVRIRVFSQAFTVTPGGALEILPAAPAQTIPKQQTREFRLTWSVPEHTFIGKVEVEHYCIRVEIDRYVDPRDPDRNEIVVTNNSAQSNFDTTTAVSGSPSERRDTGVTIANGLERRATYQIAIDQDSPWFRTYLGHSWLRLEGGEDEMVEIAYESLAGDPLHGHAFDQEFFTPDLPQPPNRLALTSLVSPPEGGPGDAARIVFGASLSLRGGLRTEFRQVDLLGEVVRGVVMGLRDSGAEVLTAGDVTLVIWLADRPEETFSASAPLGANGRFDVPTPPEIMAVLGQAEVLGEVFFLGSWPWAPCRSGVRRMG